MQESSVKACPQGKPLSSSKKHTPEGMPQQFCLCIDYSTLKPLLPAITPAIGTKKGAFTLMPLPKIDELFALLKAEMYFTALDLQSGYYHIKLDEESITKSAFTTVFGKFEFLRLPFVLSQGPDFFICLIYDLFGLKKMSTQGQSSVYLAYLENILIYSRTEKKMPANARQSLQMFAESQTQNQVEQMFIL